MSGNNNPPGPSNGGGDQGNNNNENGSGNGNRPTRPRNRNNQQNVSRFKGKIETLSTLGMKSDKRTDSFMVFQNGIHDYVISNLDYATDIAPLIKDFVNPMPILMRNIPTKKKLKIQAGIDPNIDDDKLSNDEKELVEGISEIVTSELKLFSTRRNILFQNITKLFGIIWGQCTPSLQEDIRGLQDYKNETDSYNTLWLLENLKRASSGNDKAQYEYLTIVKNLKSLFMSRQGDNESLEHINTRLESSLQNLKLAKGSLAFKPLVEKEIANGTDKQNAEKRWKIK